MIGSHLPARILAAVIDYLIVKSAAGIFIPGSVLGFFVVASVYFTAGNSAILGGATAGKRFFGLRVEGLNHKNQLSVFHGFLRFFFLYGVIISLGEVPTYFFRQSQTVAPLYILDLHLFFAMAYFLSLLALVVFSADHRGIHDYISSSFVTRSDSSSAPENSKFFIKKNIGIILIATAFSILLWIFSALKPPAAEAILSQKYKLENDFGLEIAGADYIEQPKRLLFIRCISYEKLEEDEVSQKLAALSEHLVGEGLLEEDLILHYLVLNVTEQSQKEYIFDGKIKAVEQK